MTTSNTNSDTVTEIPLVLPAQSKAGISPDLFRQCLMDNLRDGIVFVDSNCRIMVWSQTVEVMTGLSTAKVEGVSLCPSLLGLTDENGNEIPDDENPLLTCFRSRKKINGNFRLVGRSGREVKVELTILPVMAECETLQGAVVLVHDSSVQIDLQRQLRDLYEFSMLDPLTQVANRAEFERVMDEYVRAGNSSDFKFSLIVCDIDYFKQINDNYNHHIGDQALISFASLLKKFVRSHDVVARYGGEEFVILCANCDLSSAMQRAEEIRVTLTRTPQQMLDGKCITASFGVSQYSAGDTATDFFVQADTALLRAKELGRNRVVSSSDSELEEDWAGSETSELTSLAGVKWRKLKGQPLFSDEYGTSTPIPILIEKLRCYIIETDSEIKRCNTDFATLVIECEDQNNFSRKGTFIVDVEFKSKKTEGENRSFGVRKKTFIRITVREGKKKWFSTNATDLAPQVVSDLRRYLMINDDASRLQIQPATKHMER
ncbi:MAG: diguanylate cyclase [Mariniblastus sp.]